MQSAQQLWLEQAENVLETLNQGVIINNERKQIVFANSGFLEMIKMSPDDLLGQSIVNFYPAEDVTPLLEFIARREIQRPPERFSNVYIEANRLASTDK